MESKIAFGDSAEIQQISFIKIKGNKESKVIDELQWNNI